MNNPNHQPPMAAAIEGREAGISQAADHAEREFPGWFEKAYGFLVSYIKQHDREFMTEDVRLAAEAAQVPPPPDNRAWGNVIREAAKIGVIVKRGFAPAKTGHCRPMPLWSRA